MQWTIKKRLYALSLAGITLVISMGVLANQQINTINKQTKVMLTDLLASRHHSISDMMHDALRADVFSALLSQNEEEKKNAVEHNKDHAEIFRHEQEENRKLDLNPAIRALISDAEPAIEEYIKSSEKIVALSMQDAKAGHEAFPAFDAIFKMLEEKMGKMGEDIAAAADKEVNQNDKVISKCRNILIALGVFATLLLSIFAHFIMRSIILPLGKTVKVLDELADGNLTTRLDINGTDEIGQMAKALNRSIENIRITLKAIDEHSETLSFSSKELTEVSKHMAGNAEHTSKQMEVVARGSNDVNINVQSLASGTEEMGASIQEIAHTAGDAAKVAGDAVQMVDQANLSVQRLGESSSRIGNIIKMITSIAEQTNLLALNATIEAARAGEAGKGFAVVANEVKELAKETAKATDEISKQVGGIQSETQSTVEVMVRISDIISKISEMQTTIAGAVEEQSATTKEISGNISMAARGSLEITGSIDDVVKAAKEANSDSVKSLESANQFALMSDDFKKLVHRFKL